jgi:hypothetical protein
VVLSGFLHPGPLYEEYKEKKNNESKSDNKLMAQDTQKYENTIYGPLWS